MEQMQVFEHADFGRSRGESVDGEPWFVASDIAKALGYGHTPHMTRRLDDDEKGVRSVDTPGGKQSLTVVSEAGLYNAVLGSKIPEAKAFQRWVTHEVLPAIRRTGGYVAARADETPDEIMARALMVAKETMERQKARLAALEGENEALRPKALFADAVAASDGTCLVGEMAKMLRQNGVEVGQNRLFGWLRDNGYLGRSGSNRNVPTQRAMDMGLFRIKETAITHSDGHVTVNRTPKVTGKGQRYFIEKFKVGV